MSFLEDNYLKHFPDHLQKLVIHHLIFSYYSNCFLSIHSQKDLSDTDYDGHHNLILDHVDHHIHRHILHVGLHDDYSSSKIEILEEQNSNKIFTHVNHLIEIMVSMWSMMMMSSTITATTTLVITTATR